MDQRSACCWSRFHLVHEPWCRVLDRHQRLDAKRPDQHRLVGLLHGGVNQRELRGRFPALGWLAVLGAVDVAQRQLQLEWRHPRHRVRAGLRCGRALPLRARGRQRCSPLRPRNKLRRDLVERLQPSLHLLGGPHRPPCRVRLGQPAGRRLPVLCHQPHPRGPAQPGEVLRGRDQLGSR